MTVEPASNVSDDRPTMTAARQPAPLRTIFFGSPEFAVVVLRRLLAADSPVEVVAVVTQPDKPVGRRQEVTPPPVKVVALECGLPVMQPISLRRPAAVAALQRFATDLGVVAAYGKILPPPVLAVPRLGYLNIHASLLPRWRGAWPAGAAIFAGDAETGATIMRLDEGMDTGPLLAQRRERIRPDDTTGALEARLAPLGAALLVEVMPGFAAGQLAPLPQDDRAATYCHVVRKADGRLAWTSPAIALERQVRAMQPAPVAYTYWQGKLLNVHRARAVPTGASGDKAGDPPGAVVALGKLPAVSTAAGRLVLDAVQLEGRGIVEGAAFLNGHRHFLGSLLE